MGVGEKDKADHRQQDKQKRDWMIDQGLNCDTQHVTRRVTSLEQVWVINS